MTTLHQTGFPPTPRPIALRSVFVAGATGYLGSRLISQLLNRGHRVSALARKGSEQRVPSGSRVVVGDALDSHSFREQIGDADTYVQLIGTPHPSPSKSRQFREN